MRNFRDTRARWLCVSTVALALLPVCHAQAGTPKSTNEVLLARWNEIGNKLVQMAQEFPEDKYSFQPVDGVRSFAAVLRHVAFWNQYVVKKARGESPDGNANELSPAEYPNKAAIVTALKKSVEDGAAILKAPGAGRTARELDLWTSLTGHADEHYGQLVVYYRLNKLVPPATRAENGGS